MNKKGFTLIELLAIIALLAIVIILTLSILLPVGTEAREKSFRLEATNVIKGTEKALKDYNSQKFELDGSSTDKCYNAETKNMCFTIAALVDLGYYDLDDEIKENFKGKVILNGTDNNPTYTLYFKKNDEFRFVGLKFNDYNKDGELDNDDWEASYESCVCD